MRFQSRPLQCLATCVNKQVPEICNSPAVLYEKKAPNVSPYSLEDDQKGQDVKYMDDGLRRDGNENGEKQTLVWKITIMCLMGLDTKANVDSATTRIFR